MDGFGGMSWEDMLGMGFRNPDPSVPSIPGQDAFTSQLLGMMKATGIANAHGLAQMFGRLLDMVNELGYGINLAVSPNGDEFGLMMVQLNPDRANETMSPNDFPNVDAAFIASFGPGTVDRMADHVARIRNGEFS